MTNSATKPSFAEFCSSDFLNQTHAGQAGAVLQRVHFHERDSQLVAMINPRSETEAFHSQG